MDKTDDIIRNAAADIAATPPVLRDGGAAMAAAAGADEERLRDAIAESSSPYREFWYALSRMPGLSHRPDPSKPFDPALSEVYAYIVRECGHLLGLSGEFPEGLEGLDHEDFRLLGLIHSSARERGVVRFDPETKLWRGTMPPWKRYRRPARVRTGRNLARYDAYLADERLTQQGNWPEPEEPHDE